MQHRAERPAPLLTSAGWWALLLAASSLFGQVGSAQVSRPAPRAAIQWVRLPGAEQCIDASELSREVEAKLGRPLASPRDADLLLEGHVARDEAGFHAELRMQSQSGESQGTRQLASEQADCKELSETLILVLTLMIDPEATSRPPEPVKPPPAVPPPVPPVLPQPKAPQPLVTSQQLLVFSRLTLGLLTETAIGLGAAYELGFRRFGGLRLEGVGYFDETAYFPRNFVPERDDGRPPAPRYVELTLAHAGLSYCPLWFSRRRLTLTGCLGGELGRLVSEGEGFVRSETKATLYGAGTASLRATVPVYRALVVQVGASLLKANMPKFEALAHNNINREIAVSQALSSSFDVALGARF